MARQRLRVTVEGVVQGVGFRPFVHRLATRLGLGGTVRNSGDGVTLEVEGEDGATDRFVEELRREPPPLAELRSVDVEALAPLGEVAFCVLTSSAATTASRILVPPDVATCPACLEELRDPSNRRYRYPFINCTDCGPRFTIIEALPYDRPQTGMKGFELCPDCRREYTSISDRRYHAQPVACPRCGPRVWLADPRGEAVDTPDPPGQAARRLERGEIGAIRGLGGFHLACDGSSAAAVERLRERKRRPHKPFAVMARDVDAVRRFARLGPEEREILEGWRRPIVLLEALPDGPLCAAVGGSSAWVGAMLPYTPLHQLLLESAACPALVMTSGNLRDEPIICEPDEALAKLGGVVDFFLLHDRPIVNRADDSVVALMSAAGARSVSPVRRSRGYVPAPIALPRGGPSVLALGADLKNTCCVTRGDQALCSQHVGDLEHPDAADLLGDTARRLCTLFGVSPELVVYDLHPDYHSSRLAAELLPGAATLALQHHHAHALSCLAENLHDGPALALTLDGTGHGTDGAVWGGELLRVDGLDFDRLAHLRYLPLPGGDRAAREPWRMALAVLGQALGPRLPDAARALPPFSARPELAAAVLALAGRPGACPLTSSTGRLFDAVASLLGLRQEATFEGQAAMELEEAARAAGDLSESFPWRRVGDTIDLLPAVARLVDERLEGRSAAELARVFHNTLAAALVETSAELARITGIATVALSGGALQSRILHRLLVDGLQERGLRPLWQTRVPPNDGGLSLGQAWAGLLRLARPAP